MNKINEFTCKWMALIVLVTALVSLFYPPAFLFIKTSCINYLLMIIMFGMGLVIKPQDFVLIFSKPKNVIFGCITQYTIMPAIAFLLCKLFHLDLAMTAGVILVGTCPGGTASNVITYLSKGDIALSVCITSVNTLLAPVLTPLITYFLLRTSIEINIISMFISILQIVIVPIILGIIINKFFGKFTQKMVNILPVVSIVLICIIISSVVSHNAENIFTSGIIILVVVVIHNILGYLSGFVAAKAVGMNIEEMKAISIEIGMQNSGLATGLASTAFPNLYGATVPGAIFSVWHNISGAILAAIYRNWSTSKDIENIKEEK